MTDKVFPSNARDITETILGNLMRYAGGSDPGWVVPSGTAKLADSARNGFGETHSSSSYDVTIDTGEAFVHGIWVDRDTTTTVTLAASTADQTVYVGVDTSQQNKIIIGLASDFSADDPKMEIWSFDTDGSGVTSATDERYTAPGRGLDVDNADTADNATNVTSTYKGNDIDTNGDGKVDNADTADEVAGQIIPAERFQVSGSVGGDPGVSYSISADGFEYFQEVDIDIPAGKKLIAKRIRYNLGASDLRFNMTGNYSDNNRGEETPNLTLSDNSSGGTTITYRLSLGVKNQGATSTSISPTDGWWIDLSIE